MIIQRMLSKMYIIAVLCEEHTLAMEQGGYLNNLLCISLIKLLIPMYSEFSPIFKGLLHLLDYTGTHLEFPSVEIITVCI